MKGIWQVDLLKKSASQLNSPKRPLKCNCNKNIDYLFWLKIVHPGAKQNSESHQRQILQIWFCPGFTDFFTGLVHCPES